MFDVHYLQKLHVHVSSLQDTSGHPQKTLFFKVANYFAGFEVSSDGVLFRKGMFQFPTEVSTTFIHVHVHTHNIIEYCGGVVYTTMNTVIPFLGSETMPFYSQ